MLNIREDDGLIRIGTSGKLSEADYEVFVPLFERIAARTPGTVPMLIDLAPDFARWDIGGLWRDLKFDMRYKHRFGRMAIVGTEHWQEWATNYPIRFSLRYGAFSKQREWRRRRRAGWKGAVQYE